MSDFKKKYFDQLTASRFFAFLLIFIAHCFISTQDGTVSDSTFFRNLQNYSKLGILGVDYFFVFSSFLITYISLEEIHFTGKFNYKNFVSRRALRIWPLYFLIVALGFSIYFSAQAFGLPINSLPNILYFLTFTLNFYIISEGNEFLFFLLFLWSISIEEQFYLIWGFCIRFMNRYLELLAISLIICSIIYRAYIYDTSQLAFELHTLSVAGNFGMGALGAIWAFKKKPLFNWYLRLPVFVHKFIFILIPCAIFTFPFWSQFYWLSVLSRFLFSLLFIAYILNQGFSKRLFFKPGSIKLFNFSGKISYGLYCYHGVVITLVSVLLRRIEFSETFAHLLFLYPLLILLLSYPLAAISYKFFEKPFLMLKSKFY